MDTTTDTITRTFEVLLSRKDAVDAALTALAKRAVRKGIPGCFAWSWGAAYKSTVTLPNKDGVPPCLAARLSGDGDWIMPVARVQMTLTGATPRHRGWSFIACLQHLSEENIVRVVQGAELPPVYRTRRSWRGSCGRRGGFRGRRRGSGARRAPPRRTELGR